MTAIFRTVGIDVGGSFIKIAVLQSDGQILAKHQLPTLAGAGPEQAVVRILEEVRSLMRQEKLEASEMRAVGLDSAGVVDTERNLVLDSPNLRSWEGFPLAERIGARLGLPAYLENDVNAMAYGEWRCGAGRGVRHLLCLTLGTGVGGGLVLDGRLYRGARGAAGEIGHVTIDYKGPRCNCGNTGCLERYLGASFIVERALERLEDPSCHSRLRETAPEELTPRLLSEAADGGDALARDVLEESGVFLGIGLAGLVNVLNPERIVVGGGVARAGDKILEPARRTMRERAMRVPAETAEIVPAALGNDASIVGAALLGLARAQET